MHSASKCTPITINTHTGWVKKVSCCAVIDISKGSPNVKYSIILWTVLDGNTNCICDVMLNILCYALLWFPCGCSYLFTLLLSSQFHYYSVKINSLLFLTHPVCYCFMCCRETKQISAVSDGPAPRSVSRAHCCTPKLRYIIKRFCIM